MGYGKGGCCCVTRSAGRDCPPLLWSGGHPGGGGRGMGGAGGGPCGTVGMSGMDDMGGNDGFGV